MGTRSSAGRCDAARNCVKSMVIRIVPISLTAEKKQRAGSLSSAFVSGSPCMYSTDVEILLDTLALESCRWRPQYAASYEAWTTRPGAVFAESEFDVI